MEQGEFCLPGSSCRWRWSRRCQVLVGVGVVVLVGIIVGVAVWVSVSCRWKSEGEQFKCTFFGRCKEVLKESDCPKIWEAFQQAYVNRNSCNIPVEAYDPLIAAAPFQPAYNRMMFWSGTDDVVHYLTKKKDCFVTMEDMQLGKVLNELTWCGKEGSNETFTSGCPEWSQCNSPVRSFWTRASASYADTASGRVTAMLKGSEPYRIDSTFRTVEIKRLNPTKVTSLTVVLVTQNKEENCANPSLKELQMDLKKGIAYDCKETSESQIYACSRDPDPSCRSCW